MGVPDMSDPLPEPLSPVFAVLAGEINQFSLHRLFHVITSAAQNNRATHLLLQSTGGNASDGVALYNFLKRFPIPVTIYNVGTVASAATIGFLGAHTRLASRYAAFMIHRPY